MNDELQPETRNPKPESRAFCAVCSGSGWKPIEVAGVRRMIVCGCRVRARREEAKKHPGGLVPVGELLRKSAVGSWQSAAREAAFTSAEKRIRNLILARRGKDQAISIREILERLNAPGESGVGSREYGWTERDVKAVVEKLRTLGGLQIAASKEKPYGYFIPASAEECDECHDRLFSEGVKLIILSRLFRPEADLVEELRGQLQLQKSAVGSKG